MHWFQKKTSVEDPEANGYRQLMLGKDKNAAEGEDDFISENDQECTAEQVPRTSAQWKFLGLERSGRSKASKKRRATFELSTTFADDDDDGTNKNVDYSRTNINLTEVASLAKSPKLEGERDSLILSPADMLRKIYPKISRVAEPLEKRGIFTKEAFYNYINGVGSGEQRKKGFLFTVWSRAPLVNHVFDYRRATSRRGTCVLSPDSKIMMVWDVLIVTCVLGTLIIAPVEIAILVHPMFFILNVIMDSIFISDIFINMTVAFEERRNVSLHMNFNRKDIIQRYMRGWFFIDVLCAVPLDLVAVANAGSEFQHFLRALRIMRLFRIFKIQRLQIIQRMDVDFVVLTVVKCLLLSLTTAHWLACLWAGLVLIQSNKTTTWLDALIRQKLDIGLSERHHPGSLYVWSLYYSCTLITTVGFGDVVPQTNLECIVCTLDVVLGSILWAFILSSLLRLLNNVNPHRIDFEHTMDELNAMMHDHCLPDALRHDVRHYFFECEDLWKFQRRGDLIHRMSPSLKGRVTLALSGEWIEKIEYIRQLFTQSIPDSTHFVVEISRHLVPKIFSPGEQLIGPALYVIRKGLVANGPRILSVGDVCGEDLLMHSELNRSPFVPIALTTAGTLALSKAHLTSVLEDFPPQKQSIRHYMIWLACKRGFARVLRSMANVTEPNRESVLWLRTIGKGNEHVETAEDEDIARQAVTVSDLMTAMAGLKTSLQEQHDEICRMFQEAQAPITRHESSQSIKSQNSSRGNSPSRGRRRRVQSALRARINEFGPRRS